MFEKKVILIQLGIFVGLLLAVFTTYSLMANGVISRESISAFIVIEMFGTAIVGWTLAARYQRSKIFRPLIEDKLKDQGLIFVSERPLNAREIVGHLEFAPAIAISDIPLSNFITKRGTRE